MTSVCRLIRETAPRHGDRTALSVRVAPSGDGTGYRAGRDVDYAELHDLTHRLGTALDRHGLVRGDRVAVLLDNSVEMVASEWCCLLFGYLWVALNARSSPEELLAILLDSKPSVLLVASSMRGRLDAIEALGGTGLLAGLRILEVGEECSGDSFADWVATAEPGSPRAETAAEDPVRIRYTSGTSGRPKGAVLPRRAYDASVEAVTDVIAPIRADDVLLQAAPMTHASGAMLLPHARVGARALLLDRFETDAFIDSVERDGGTTVFLVPTMLVRLIERLDEPPTPRRLRTLRTIVYGGASMPADRLLAGLGALGPVFAQIYGLTESTWPVTALRREEHLPTGEAAIRPASETVRRRLMSCGRPTGVGDLRIVDESGTDAGIGEIGEIRVRGANTMLGYWDSATSSYVDAGDQDTSGALKGLDADGWMHTGDVATRDADGFVTIVDRLHDMIVTGGFNVYPREVEDVLSTHPAVLESAVVGLPDPEWGERVHAAVVLREGKSVSETELSEHCASHLTGYKKPRSIEVVAALPRNASGKILRRALRTRS